VKMADWSHLITGQTAKLPGCDPGFQKQPPARKHKFNAKRVELDGRKFDSKSEAIRYQCLRFLEQSGEVRDLVLQPEFLLQEAVQNGFTVIRPIIYRADFAYWDKLRDGIVVEDVKGFPTPEFRTKWKLVRARYPQYQFRVVDKDGEPV